MDRSPSRGTRTPRPSESRSNAPAPARWCFRSTSFAPRAAAGSSTTSISPASRRRAPRARSDVGNRSVRSRVVLFRQLQEDAGRPLRMQEGDAPPAGTPARDLVDESIPRRAAPLECLLEVRDTVADVMDAGAAFGEKLGDGAGRIAWLQQLDLDLTQRERHDRRSIGALGR